MGIFSSLFSSSNKEETTDNRQKDDNKNFDILKYDGLKALNMRKPDYAVKFLTEALKTQEDFECMRYLMSAYIMLNDLRNALEVLNKMALAEPKDISTLLTRANVLFMLEQYAELISDCETILELEPENHLACFHIAKAKNAMNELENSIEYLTKTISFKDDFIDAYMLRSEVYLLLKRGNEALLDVEKIISITEDDENAYMLRGRVHEFMENYDSALNDFQYVLELNPFSEDACLLAGKLMIKLEKYNEAIALFDEATEHIESFAKAYELRAQMKMKKGDREGAAEDMEKYAELSNEDDEIEESDLGFDNLYKGNII